MALTPQMIQAMNQASGNNVPLNPNAPPSRADQIRAIGKSATPTPSAPPEQSLGTRMGADVQNAGNQVNEAITGTGASTGDAPVTRGFEAAGAAAGSVPTVAAELLPQSARTALGTVSKAGSDVINWLGEKLGSTKLAQDFVMQHPAAADSLGQMAKIGTNAGTIANTALIADAGAKISSTGVKTAVNTAKDALDTTPPAIKSLNSDLQSLSGGFEDGVKTGEIPHETVFSQGNMLKPEAAAGRIADAANKLDRNFPGQGLGDKLKASVDPNSVEMVNGDYPGLKQAALKIANDHVNTPVNTQQTKAVDSLENDYYKWGGMTKSGVKNIAKTDAKTEALNNAGTTGKTPQRVLAEHGVVPKIQGTKFDTAAQANDFRAGVQPLSLALKDSLKQVDRGSTPMAVDDLEQSAKDRINAQNMTEGDKKSLLDNVSEEFGLLRQKYGDHMTTAQMNDAKSPYWGSTKFDSTKPFKGDANYQVGKSLQKGIEDVATKAGFTDVAQLNREIGDKLEAGKYLDSLSGNTLKYGKIGKYAFMTIGASLGRGIVGKVLGALGGEAVGELLMKADVADPVKRLVLNSIKAKSPEAYEATLKWLQDQGQAQAGRLQLPAPSQINLPGVEKPVPPTRVTNSYDEFLQHQGLNRDIERPALPAAGETSNGTAPSINLPSRTQSSVDAAEAARRASGDIKRLKTAKGDHRP